ncbi:MAG: DUF1405 domain-containing protein [Nanoarchaeota archaeon]|nr:DUF1405 domain-containing protein [Nanoarchaeota archaeon]
MGLIFEKIKKLPKICWQFLFFQSERLKINDLSERILGDKRWLLAFFAINFIGFFYGIYYYSYQLSITPAHLWIFTIDSPLPVLLFAAVCAFLFLRKTPPQWLILFAFFGLVKYGVWTDIVIFLFRDVFFAIDALTYSMNVPLHFGMILEGLLLIRLLKPKISDIVFVGGFYLLNDYMDYFMGNVTLIPAGHHTFLMIESFAMTVALIGIAIHTRAKKCQIDAR